MDGQQPGTPVIEKACEHYADDALTKVLGCCPEEQVNRRTMAVVLWTANYSHAVALEQHVAVGLSYVNYARLNGVGICRLMCRQPRVAVQDVGKQAAAVRRNMQRNKNGSLEIGRELCGELLHCLHPACRRAYDYDVVHWIDLV